MQCDAALCSRLHVWSAAQRPRHWYQQQDAHTVSYSIPARMQAIFWANVRRQVSLAGGKGGSQEPGAKALGLFCSSQALCLSAELRQTPLESWIGQRLTARPCSHIFVRGPASRGFPLACRSGSEGSIPASSFWNILFSGGLWQARGWGNRKSFHAAPLEYFCCGMKSGGPSWRS